MRWPALAFALVASIVTLVLVFRKEGDLLTPELLDAARTRWQERGPKDYDLEIVTSGAREARHVVEVRAGKVVRQTTDGAAVPERVRGIWSVPGMFETLRVELSNATHPKVPYGIDDPEDVIVRAAFDDEFGYPRRFMRHVLAGRKSSIEWEVVRFAPAP